jgi:hypothetical protein
MKRKSVLAILVLTIVLSVVVSVTAAADCGCGCDCGCAADCSPGFWKNHTELWMDDFAADYDWMIAGLTAKGWQDNFGDRWVATDMLNDYYPDAPCHD